MLELDMQFQLEQFLFESRSNNTFCAIPMFSRELVGSKRMFFLAGMG